MRLLTGRMPFLEDGMVFCSDLDNTLIYSYKHEIGPDKKCVETYQGREVSYMTNRSCKLLRQVRERMLFVPTTTRTVEQYQRVVFGEGPPEYALVCNGGVLLVNGRQDSGWYEESLGLVSGSQAALQEAVRVLEADRSVNFEVRWIERLFVFTKSMEPRQTVCRLQEYLQGGPVEVFSLGAKVYVVPGELNKGEAVRRFRRRVRAGAVAAAGDSRFDIPMLEEADFAIADKSLKLEHIRGSHVAYLGEGAFSDEALEYVLSLCRRERPGVMEIERIKTYGNL